MSYRYREGSLLVGSCAAVGLALNMSMEKLAEGLIAVRPRCQKNIFRMCEAVHSVAVDQIPLDDNLCRAASGRLLIGRETIFHITYLFVYYFLCSFGDGYQVHNSLCFTADRPSVFHC